MGKGRETCWQTEVKLSGNEVDDGDEVLGILVSAGSPFGGLDESVDGLEDPVTDLGVEPVEDAVPVVADGPNQEHEGP